MEHSMADLRVVALIPGKEGSADTMRAALTTLAEATLSHEGCTGYELFESAADPGTFVTVESWRSQAHLDAHMQTDDIATALGAANGHLAGDIAIHPLVPVPE
jgi:quinol monooxygenase YgiN